MAINVERIPNRGALPTILIREAWREGKPFKRRTRAYLIDLPEHIRSGIDTLLRGGVAVQNLNDVFAIFSRVLLQASGTPMASSVGAGPYVPP